MLSRECAAAIRLSSFHSSAVRQRQLLVTLRSACFSTAKSLDATLPPPQSSPSVDMRALRRVLPPPALPLTLDQRSYLLRCCPKLCFHRILLQLCMQLPSTSPLRIYKLRQLQAQPQQAPLKRPQRPAPSHPALPAQFYQLLPHTVLTATPIKRTPTWTMAALFSKLLGLLHSSSCGTSSVALRTPSGTVVFRFSSCSCRLMRGSRSLPLLSV